MKTMCGCGKFIRDYGGKSGLAVEECAWCSENDGNYCKSPSWDTKRDEEDARKVTEHTAYNAAMDKVIPLDRTKQGKKRASKRR